MDEENRFLILSKLYDYPIQEVEFFGMICYTQTLLKYILLYLTCVLNYTYDRIDMDEHTFIHIQKENTHIVCVFRFGYFQNIILNEHKILLDQFLSKVNSGEIC